MPSPCKYHYQIRCPHCLATLKNDQVEFEVDANIISQLESDLKIKPKKNRGGDNTKRTIEELRAIQEALEASEKKKLAEIEFVNLSDEQPDNGQLPIVLPRGFSEETKDNYPNIVEEELTTEVIIRTRDDTDQAWTIKTSTDRYCSKCDKSKMLPIQAGIMPLYHITMIGPSTSGKTIMLVMQYIAAGYNANTINMNVYNGTVEIRILKDYSGKTVDSIRTVADELIAHSQFPPTTQELLPTPHCIQVNYKQWEKKDGVEAVENDPETLSTSSAIIVFQDIKGENFTSYQSKKEREKLNYICQHTDGVYIITDPCTLAACYGLNNNAPNTANTAIADLFELIGYLNDNVPGLFKKACACILSKTDMLYYNSNVIDQKVSNDNDYSLINNDVINFDSDVSFSFNGEDTNWSNILDKLSSDTKLTINRLDLNGAWSRALTMLGAKACFFPVSSIGKDLQVIIIPYYADAANPAQKSQPTQPSQSAQPVYNNSEYLAPMEAINTSMNEEVFTPQKSIDVPTEPKEVLTERGLVKSTDRRNPNRGGSGNIHNNAAAPQSAPPPQPAPADSTPQRQLSYKKCLVKTEIAQKFNELSFDEKIVYGKELLDTMDSNINSQLEYKNWNENISPYFNPRNIELPLLFMLMKFNIIPNILEGDFVSAEQESRDKAFKTWIRNYGWRDATTPKKSTHTDPVPVPPKNWLDKLIDKIVDFFSSLFGK